MSPSPAQGVDARGTTASSSCFAVAWRVWSLCLLPVVLVFSSVAVAAVFVVLLPFACMAASLCLVCAIMALLVAPPDGETECGGGSDNYGASSGEEEEQEGEAELEMNSCQECTAAYADGAQFTDPRGDEQEQFFWVDAGSYYCYKKFYDLLAFWRRKETAGWR